MKRIRDWMRGARRRWRALVAGDLDAGLRGGASTASTVRWHGARTEAQALRALSDWAAEHLASASTGGDILCLGDGGGFHRRLERRLARAGIPHRSLSLEQALALAGDDAATFAAVLCTHLDARRQTNAARLLADHPVFAGIPFEHVAGLDESHEAFRRLDEYVETEFISPVLLDEPGPYEIYRQSLAHFEQKCGLRDFLDLYQVLRWIVVADVPGDVAEFGSFRGHSGWLIARSLEALGSDKRVFLFDTFESFPAEGYGVDHFWSATHPVSFEDVRAKFADRPAVTLVKGDFTQTLAESGADRLALAYVDCDSYRATRYLLETLPDEYLVPRGALVCEDYGHPALLGHRVAVHQCLDGSESLFRFFSQFSGLHIFLKVE